MGWGTHDTFYCVEGIMRRRDCMNRTEAAGWNKVCTSVDKQNHFFNIWDSKSQRFRNVPASRPLRCAANVRRSWFLSRDAATKNAERNFPNQKTLSKRQLTVQLQIFPEHFWTGCSLRMQKGDHGFFFIFFLKSRRRKEGTNSRRQLRTQQPLTPGGSEGHGETFWLLRLGKSRKSPTFSTGGSFPASTFICLDPNLLCVS